jgi:hypothetical protein
MLSWRRNESLPPSAAAVISVKIGCRGAADQMRRGRPSNDLPARRVSPPSHLPLADVLDAVRVVPAPTMFVADGGAEA